MHASILKITYAVTFEKSVICIPSIYIGNGFSFVFLTFLGGGMGSLPGIQEACKRAQLQEH